ncbi:choice-of-anchor E domain-containing protein [Oxalobacteraceae bacterium A2-2]
MNKMIKAAVAGALLAVGFAANAASVTVTSDTVNDITHLPSGSSISLAGFNTSLGTLTSAQFTFYSTISGTLAAENAANYAVDTVVGAGGKLSLVGSGLSLTASTVYSETLHLGAVDYDIDNDDPDFAGTGGKTVTFVNKSSSATSPLYTGSSLSAFTAGAPLNFSFTGLALSTGDGNADYLASSIVNAKVSVTYTYTAAPVPEPETYGMLLAGLGLVGAIARRKAKKSA